MVAGRMPNFASLTAKLASSAPIATSQAQTRPKPPPRAAPCTRATTGLGQVSMRAIIAAKLARVGQVPFLRCFAGTLHPVQIGAGAEMPAAAGEYDNAHIVGLDQFVEDPVNVGDHGFVEGVEHLRARHRDLGDTGARPADFEVSVVHRESPVIRTAQAGCGRTASGYTGPIVNRNPGACRPGGRLN